MKIVIKDGQHPEDLAMLQALYSRSPASVDEHDERVAAAGSGNFMSRYYVGYGHRSIGDCGSTTLFVEGVSILAAKAIQDWPLYSGQESSTRYIDFSKQKILDPLGTQKSAEIIDSWMSFYFASMEPLRAHLREKYPRRDGEDEAVYERAIGARSFDVLRAFLPAGATTNVSWHTNLRQAADKLSWLVYHPEPDIRAMARQIAASLLARYPNSFRERTPGSDVERYYEWVTKEHAYLDRSWEHADDALVIDGRVDPPATCNRILSDRPRGAELPPFMSAYGQLTSSFLIDFGSFRDLQRHRNGVVRMPLLTTRHGFHCWYLDEMPEGMQESAKALISWQKEAIRALDASPEVAQHYVALGFVVVADVTQSLPAFIYRLELRTQKTVHPTLRQVTQCEAAWFRQVYPGIALHVDMDPDDWDIRRGKQTITAR